MSFKVAVQKKVLMPETTLELFREKDVTRHEAAITGISELPAARICKLLKTHPYWIMQTFYCKAIRKLYARNVP